MPRKKKQKEIPGQIMPEGEHLDEPEPIKAGQYQDEGKKWVGPSIELQAEQPVCPKCGGKGQVQAPDLPEGYMIPCPQCQKQQQQGGGMPPPQGPPPVYKVGDRVILWKTGQYGKVIAITETPSGQKLQIEIEGKIELGGLF
jgi:hypothetical protein